MKDFIPVTFDFSECRKQVEELRDLLNSHGDLKESEDILPFFQARLQLSALCGLYHVGMVRYDRVAWEYDLFGDFACDLVVGDSFRKVFAFLEFEDATPKSLFRKVGKKATAEWSDRFEHGFSQIIDWFYKLADQKDTEECEKRFGKRAIDYVGILIAGRDGHLQPGERFRLDWRRERVIVDSRRIVCRTFDGLYEDMCDHLRKFEQGGKSLRRRKSK